MDDSTMSTGEPQWPTRQSTGSPTRTPLHMDESSAQNYDSQATTVSFPHSFNSFNIDEPLDLTDIGKDFVFAKPEVVNPNRFLKDPGKVNYDELQMSDNLPSKVPTHATGSSQNISGKSGRTKTELPRVPAWNTPTAAPSQPQRPTPPNTAPSAPVPLFNNPVAVKVFRQPRQDHTITPLTQRDSGPDQRDVADPSAGYRPNHAAVRAPHSVVSDRIAVADVTRADQRMLSNSRRIVDEQAGQPVGLSTSDMQPLSKKPDSQTQNDDDIVVGTSGSSDIAPHQASSASGRTSSSRLKRPDRGWKSKPRKSRHSRTTPRPMSTRPKSRASVVSNIGKRRSYHAAQSGYYSPSLPPCESTRNKRHCDPYDDQLQRMSIQESHRLSTAAEIGRLLNNMLGAKAEEDELNKARLAELRQHELAVAEHCKELEDTIEQKEAEEQERLEEINALNAQLNARDDRVKRCQDKLRHYKNYLNGATEENQTLYKKTKEHHQQALADVRAEAAAQQSVVGEAVKKAEADRTRFMGTLNSIRDESQKQAREFQLKLQNLSEKLHHATSQLNSEKEHAEALKNELHDKSELMSKLSTLEDNIDEKTRMMTESHTKLVEKMEMRDEENRETVQNVLERLKNLDDSVSEQSTALSTFQESHDNNVTQILEKNEEMAQGQSLLQESTSTLTQELRQHITVVEDDLRQRGDVLEDELMQCQDENSDLQRQLGDTGDAYNEAVDELDRMEAITENQEAQIQHLTQQLEEMQSAGVGDEQLAAQMEEAKQKYDKLKDEVESKAAAIANLEGQLKAQAQASAKALHQQKETLQKSEMLQRDKLRSDMDKSRNDAKIQLGKTQQERNAAQEGLTKCQEELHRLRPVEKTAHKLEATLVRLKEENARNVLDLKALEVIDKTLKKIQDRHNEHPELSAAFSDVHGKQATATELGTMATTTFVKALPRFVDKLALRLKNMQSPSAAPVRQSLPLNRAANPSKDRLPDGSDDPLITPIAPQIPKPKHITFERHYFPTGESEEPRVVQVRRTLPTVEEERIQRRQAARTKSIIKPPAAPTSEEETKKVHRRSSGAKYEWAVAPGMEQLNDVAEHAPSITPSRASGSRPNGEYKASGPVSKERGSLHTRDSRKRSLPNAAKILPQKRAKTNVPLVTKPVIENLLELHTDDEVDDDDDQSHESETENIRMIEKLVAPVPALKTWPVTRDEHAVVSKPTKATKPLSAINAYPKTNPRQGTRQGAGGVSTRKAKQNESQESMASSHNASQEGMLTRGRGRVQTMPNY